MDVVSRAKQQQWIEFRETYIFVIALVLDVQIGESGKCFNLWLAKCLMHLYKADEALHWHCDAYQWTNGMKAMCLIISPITTLQLC